MLIRIDRDMQADLISDIDAVHEGAVTQAAWKESDENYKRHERIDGQLHRKAPKASGWCNHCDPIEINEIKDMHQLVIRRRQMHTEDSR